MGFLTFLEANSVWDITLFCTCFEPRRRSVAILQKMKDQNHHRLLHQHERTKYLQEFHHRSCAHSHTSNVLRVKLMDVMTGKKERFPHATNTLQQRINESAQGESHHRGPRENHSRQDRSCVAGLCDSPNSRPSLSVCCSSVSTCRNCGLPLNCLGHHLSACLVAGRGFVVDSATARIAGREANACQRRCSCGIWISERSITGMAVVWRSWQMDCHLLVGPQLAIDTTLVSALRRDGTAREGAANRNGVAIRSAHRGSCSVGHPCWRGWRALVARDCELLRALAVAKALDVSNILQANVEVARIRRWSNILSCAKKRAFACSLLEVRGAGCAGGNAPSSYEVMGDNPF